MPRKSRSSWGSNEPSGPGKRRIRYWADKHDGRGYRRCSETVTGSRRDADLVLAQRQVEHSSDAPVPTLKQAYEMWWLPQMEDRLAKGELSRSTYDNYVSRWNRHICPTFGNAHVNDIRALAVQEWLLGLTKSMAGVSLLVLRQILALCVRYEVLDRNVAKDDYRMPSAHERTHSKEVWTVDDVCRALDALRGTRAYVPSVLCALGSCRVGESLGARVDLGEVREIVASGMRMAVVDVIRSVGLYGIVSDDGDLKNWQSVRPVVIPEPWSLDVLSVGGTWLCDNGGKPLTQLQARKTFEKSLESAGIEPIPMRNLRNSWRTFMRWELHVDEDMLERMMGHGGRNVGEMHYDRPREEVFAQTVADAWLRYRASRT